MMDNQFFLGRQPIVGMQRELVAYELLFRSSRTNAALILNDVSASAAVIQYAFSDLGVQSALGEKNGFINMSEALLMSDIIEILPRDRVVLEILETVAITPEVLARCRQLKAAGYTLAMDDVMSLSDAQKSMLPLMSFVKVDVLTMARTDIAGLVRDLKSFDVTLLAEKIDTDEQYAFCRDLGFHLFQGYFFAKPVILSGRSMQPSAQVLIKLLGLIAADAEIDELEQVLKHAPDLTLRLLRLANSAAFNRAHKVTTVRSAILMLGRLQLSRLVQIMLFAQHSGNSIARDPIIQTAAVRGRLMEGMADALGWVNIRDQAFMVGMLSLADTLFGQSRPDVLELLNLEQSLQEALLNYSGRLGALLRLVETSERPDGGNILSQMTKLGLSDFDQFNRSQVEALKWASAL
jgi:EAL and modified HD-GYP domain-containing signal transduction protein